MDVCGIDPGLEVTGYAVVRVEGDSPTLLEAGTLTTRRSDELPSRLVNLASAFAEVLNQWHPVAVGVEQLYAHYKHPRTAIQMAHARGVLLAAASQDNVVVHSLSATHVKKFLTGNGRASKQQVQMAVQAMFRLPALPEPNDVADAIAVACCCANHLTSATLEVCQ